MQHVDIFTTNDSHTLVYGGHWQLIPDKSPKSVAIGIATIISELWVEEGDDAVEMMRINASIILKELDLDESLEDEMIAVAKHATAKGES